MTKRLRPDIRRMASVVRKLVRSGPSGWWLLVQAEASILAAATLVRRRPRGELIQALSERYSAPGGGSADLRRADEIALAIDRAARFGFVRPLCLVRSIALHRLLERRRVAGSRIHVGIRMFGSTFAAHAWVELEGRVIGDDPSYVRQFAPLAGDGRGLDFLTSAASVLP